MLHLFDCLQHFKIRSSHLDIGNHRSAVRFFHRDFENRSLLDLLFFLLGYCIYIAIEVTYRGYSFRLMGIAGGLSLAGIGMLEDAGLRRFPLAFQMMVSAVLITAIELYSGMFSLRVLHYRMWDYSALPFSFCDGLICPWFFGIWYLLSVVGIFLTDYVSYYIFHEGTHPVYRKKKKGCAEGEFVIK